MTGTSFAQLVREYTHTSASELSDAKLLMLANIYKDEIASAITAVNEDYFGMIFTRNLEDDRREYALPDEILNNIKYVEAMLDGENWLRLEEFDINSYRRPTDEETTVGRFSGLAPMFDIFRRSLWIYSGEAIEEVIGGLKLWAIIFPADFTDLSGSIDLSVDPSETTFGFPRQFHELLARRVSIGWKSGQQRPRPLSAHEKNYGADLDKAIALLTKGNLDRSVVAKAPYNDGTQY